MLQLGTGFFVDNLEGSGFGVTTKGHHEALRMGFRVEGYHTGLL